MEVRIVDQTADDVLEVQSLLRDVWLDTYPNKELGITKGEILERFDDSKPDFKARMEKRMATVNKDPKHHSWVAKVDERIVGFCSAGKDQVNRVHAIYVLPEFQGQKVGWKLMNQALDWIEPANEVFVNVASYNQKAIDFYEKVGFKKTGRFLEEDVGRFPSGAVIPEIEMFMTR